MAKAPYFHRPNQSMGDDLDAWEWIARKAQAENEKLVRQVRELEARLEASRQRADIFEAQVQGRERQVRELETELAGAGAVIVGQSERIRQLEDRLADLTAHNI